MSSDSVSTATRWSILVIGLAAAICAFVFINGVAFVIPMLLDKRGTDLAVAGLLASMPSFGMVVTLFAWGYLLDRIGERIVLTVGMALTAAASFAAASVNSLVEVAVFLFFGGMAAASANTAGGRLVSGWFPPHQRGLAMGIRQTAQPLGIALGALIIPELAEQGLSSALMFPAMVCTVAAAACAIGVLDPPRKTRAMASEDELANPYRGTAVLWRIHISSAMLMVPQCVISTFMLVWLINAKHWSITSAGALVTISQLLGAAGRVAVGRWSDRAGSRMRPMRMIAGGAALAMMVLALNDHLATGFAEAAMVIASVLAVVDNGLASTAVAEIAGPFWSGRALGTQNTTQRLSAAFAPPLFGALIAATAYPVAWVVCGVAAAAALPVVPAGARLHPLGAKARPQSGPRPD